MRYRPLFKIVLPEEMLELATRNLGMAKRRAEEAKIDIDAEQQIESEKARDFQRIGEFVFWFSQLEFTIKVRLSAALGLSDNLFDAVTAHYDFAILCTVAIKVLLAKFPQREASIKKLFKDCRKLNDERVGISHGLWTHRGHRLVARHVARGTLEPRYLYGDPAVFPKLIEKARGLMGDVFRVTLDETGWAHANGSP